MTHTQVLPTPTTTTTGEEASSGARSGKALAIAALAAPLALGAAVALHPEDTTDAADTLGSIASDDRARWALTHLLEPAAWLALAVVFLGIRALPVGRGRVPVVRRIARRRRRHGDLDDRLRPADGSGNGMTPDRRVVYWLLSTAGCAGPLHAGPGDGARRRHDQAAELRPRLTLTTRGELLEALVVGLKLMIGQLELRMTR